MADRPYAFMTISKIKNFGQLTAKGNHNMRVMHNDNVIEDLSVLNRVYTDIGDSWDVTIPDGKTKEEVTFTEAYQDRIKSIPYYQDHNIRSNGVLAYEIVMSYTRDESIDPYQWAEKSMEWLHETFDHAGDGKSNVLHAVLHMDEPGNPHIHAIVVPIDEHNRLSSKAYTNGSRVMSHYQSTYAESVKEFGIQRGVAGSSAKHKDIRKLYATLNNVKADYLKPQEGQSAMEYYQEMHEYIEEKILSRYKEAEDLKVRGMQEVDRMMADARDAIKEDAEAERALFNHETKKLQQEQTNLRQSISNYQAQFDELSRQLEAVQTVFQNTAQTQEELEEYHRIKKGLRVMSELEPEKAEQYQQYLNYLGEYGEEYDLEEDVSPEYER